ncbi:hypothetical protein V9T40_007485 [Parthenolecanium corni]|uniref:Uncharacterized protein n=1 Tax=Parthenolecanium corni TaxID=536013 RepID=A0AAN9Y5W1_9HEMI
MSGRFAPRPSPLGPRLNLVVTLRLLRPFSRRAVPARSNGMRAHQQTVSYNCRRHQRAAAPKSSPFNRLAY